MDVEKRGRYRKVPKANSDSVWSGRADMTVSFWARQDRLVQTLHLAVYRESIGVIQALIEFGADFNQPDAMFTVTPLQAACGGLEAIPSVHPNYPDGIQPDEIILELSTRSCPQPRSLSAFSGTRDRQPVRQGRRQGSTSTTTMTAHPPSLCQAVVASPTMLSKIRLRCSP